MKGGFGHLFLVEPSGEKLVKMVCNSAKLYSVVYRIRHLFYDLKIWDKRGLIRVVIERFF
jgi:hypothetical protein